MEEQILLTPSALFDFLSQIEELNDKEISLDTSAGIKLNIGSSSYTIDTSKAEEFEVEEETIEDIQEINDTALDEICEDGRANIDDEPVEGGIIKELAKTLLVGGLVRLSAKLIKK